MKNVIARKVDVSEWRKRRAKEKREVWKEGGLWKKNKGEIGEREKEIYTTEKG